MKNPTELDLKQDAERRLYALHAEMLWTRLAFGVVIGVILALGAAYLL